MIPGCSLCCHAVAEQQIDDSEKTIQIEALEKDHMTIDKTKVFCSGPCLSIQEST